MARRDYYSNSIQSFCSSESNEILGEIVRNNQFALEQKQRNTWLDEISLLQQVLKSFSVGDVAFEYSIPRIGSRIDNVASINGNLFLLEFKVGEKAYPRYAVEQVMDYALDLKYFHRESRDKCIIPLLICTEAPAVDISLEKYQDSIYHVIKCNKEKLCDYLCDLLRKLPACPPIDFRKWINSAYEPTPTIIEAAQALYRGHDVKEISRSEGGADNLHILSTTLSGIIEKSKSNQRKSICFITGVPGAGKTLAGLNIANERHNFDENEHAVFLSGNGPLVHVLREALARDDYERSEHKIRKADAKRKAEAFIQNVHHFRDDAISRPEAPAEKVVIFDEAQRAWTLNQTAKFMRERGARRWSQSEPEFLISIMDRHNDWAVIVCLVGGGQEINTGEAGLVEWFDALKKSFGHWDVYLSDRINDYEYTLGNGLMNMLGSMNHQIVENLHLDVSFRSFRSEKTSAFVKAVLDVQVQTARQLLLELNENYPIVITRNLSKARHWIIAQARGSERYGMIACSEARRLKTYGIWVQNSITAENWFLNDVDDVRSSYYLEDTATEFDIQGLEIDWSLVCWDADFRFDNNAFTSFSFKGTKWTNENDEIKQRYHKNAYRVLLTRARQGMVIFIPEGSDEDKTRKPEYYNGTYDYLRALGIQEI
jgi:hypothetical protein